MLLAASLIGTVPQWLTVLALVVGAYTISRGSAGPALEIERRANETLRERNAELEKQLADRVKEVAALQARTDLEPIQASLMQQLNAHEARAVQHWQAMNEALANHEARAHERHLKECVIMDMIAERLGPELNGER